METNLKEQVRAKIQARTRRMEIDHLAHIAQCRNLDTHLKTALKITRRSVMSRSRRMGRNGPYIRSILRRRKTEPKMKAMTLRAILTS
jgi:hypothetical protein